tara:strand:+ start:1065 stop:1838 length:774 start_codon:yes stop_codon:yes gene_type:complete
MISYLCNKVKKIKQRNIKIDITEFECHKRKIIEEVKNEVKEKGISNMISDFMLKIDNIPYNIIINLCDILTLYDELEFYYAERMTQDYLKTLNQRLKQVDFLPRKIKKTLINDFSELFRMMSATGYEIDVKEDLILYREIIMYYFLQNKNLKNNLLKIKYVYICTKIDNNNFKKFQIFNNKNLKFEKDDLYQSLINKILKFYYNNNLYYESKQQILPIIGYKNNIPVCNPKYLSNYKYRYSFDTLKLIHINYISLFT